MSYEELNAEGGAVKQSGGARFCRFGRGEDVRESAHSSSVSSTVSGSKLSQSVSNVQALPGSLAAGIATLQQLSNGQDENTVARLQRVSAILRLKADTAGPPPNDQNAGIQMIVDQVIANYISDMKAGGQKASDALTGLEKLVAELNEGRLGAFAPSKLEPEEIERLNREVNRLVISGDDDGTTYSPVEAYKAVWGEESIKELTPEVEAMLFERKAIFPDGQLIPAKTLFAMKGKWESENANRMPSFFKFTKGGVCKVHASHDAAKLASMSPEDVVHSARFSTETELRMTPNGATEEVTFYRYPSAHVENWFRGMDEVVNRKVQVDSVKAAQSASLSGAASSALKRSNHIGDAFMDPSHPHHEEVHEAIQVAADALLADEHEHVGNVITDAFNGVTGTAAKVVGKVTGSVAVPQLRTVDDYLDEEKKKKSGAAVPSAMLIAFNGVQNRDKREGPFVLADYAKPLTEELDFHVENAPVRSRHITTEVKKAAAKFFDEWGFGKDLTANNEKFTIRPFYSNDKFEEFAFLPKVDIGATPLASDALKAEGHAHKKGSEGPWKKGKGKKHGHDKSHGTDRAARRAHWKKMSSHGHSHMEGRQPAVAPQLVFSVEEPSADVFSFGHMVLVKKPVTVMNPFTMEKVNLPAKTRIVYGNKILTSGQGKFDHIMFKTEVPGTVNANDSTAGTVFAVKCLPTQKTGKMFVSESLEKSTGNEKKRTSMGLLVYDN